MNEGEEYKIGMRRGRERRKGNKKKRMRRRKRTEEEKGDGKEYKGRRGRRV